MFLTVFLSLKFSLILDFVFLSSFLSVKFLLILRFGFLSDVLGVKIHLFSFIVDNNSAFDLSL